MIVAKALKIHGMDPGSDPRHMKGRRAHARAIHPALYAAQPRLPAPRSRKKADFTDTQGRAYFLLPEPPGPGGSTPFLVRPGRGDGGDDAELAPGQVLTLMAKSSAAPTQAVITATGRSDPGAARSRKGLRLRFSGRVYLDLGGGAGVPSTRPRPSVVL